MAYAVTHSLIQTINRILNLDSQKFPVSDDGKERIQQLLDQITLFRQFLGMYQKEAEIFEIKIRDAANQVEDALEHFMYERIRSQLKSDRQAAVGRTLTRAEEILHDFRELKIVMEDITPIAEEIAEIMEQKAKEHRGRPAMQLGTTSSSSSQVDTPSFETVPVGLEERVEEIRGLLCGDPGSPRHIIPITGMGGIGKTTLARTVYEDYKVVENFPVRAWIVVSQNYKTENIFEDLLFKLKGQVPKELLKENETTEQHLHRITSLKKYLIVVDDLWSEKAWYDIHKAFGDANKCDGSRIVITTRDETVATNVSPSASLHKMELMDDDKSWTLLKQKVFPEKDLAPKMEKIAKQVADSCGGLPLAIVLIAGILSSAEENTDKWGEIEADVKYADEKKNEFGKRIALSYTYLPTDLRPCFLHMGAFPEDHEIRTSKLLKQWVAEGFVGDEMEAEGKLNNIVKRNMSSNTISKSNGKIKSCNIHDMVREMAKSRALDENYERRQSIGHTDLTSVAKNYASTLRSCLSFQPSESSLSGLRKFKLLRVLDVVDTKAYSLPAPVFELFHLRYLAFGCPMEVPYAISRLQNLRTLIVRPTKRLRKHTNDEVYLPLEIWMLPLLTHLVSFFDLLPNQEGAASTLKELLTLNVVKKLICTEQMMGLLYNLKKLAITYFGDKYPNEDYQLHNLLLLTQLEKLTLVVKKGSLLEKKAKPVFPESLKKLTLSGWRFPWEYMEAIAALPKLQVLKLRGHAFEGGAWSTIDESNSEDVEMFVALEYLLIDKSDLKLWDTEKSHFPALKRLLLNRCDELKYIPEEIGFILPLKLIEIGVSLQNADDRAEALTKPHSPC
ncbi:putative late blight resistance protein homolog R1B-16 [Salvia hispanica]|uniref:putative late blight resistance protein homolog R1B-16 n=1 Tax=Salvia hispanica TaxID=49212 RepID=UPI0020096572|nr:putative late blight resistance protein homolog R1B-16 [Salvia hispanica]